jgi:hypothetical protein
MSVEIVAYGPEWTGPVLELQTYLWNPDPEVNRAYFEWKYLANPYLQPPRLQLAVVDGALVGMRGLHGARWEAGRREVFDAPCAGDLVVLPAHRSGRIVQRILEAGAAALEAGGLPAALNFSGGGPTQLASLMAGWRSAGGIEVARRGPAPLPPPSPDEAEGATAEVSIEPVCRADAMARLAAEVPADGRIRHVRDARYFAWRYRNPLSRYRFVYAWRGGLAGYVALQSHVRAAPGRVHVVDWEAVEPPLFPRLLRAAIAAGGFGEMVLWTSSLRPAARRRLAELGFAFEPPERTLGRAARAGRSRPAVLVREPGRGTDRPGPSFAGRRLLELADWDLRGIYSDYY